MNDSARRPLPPAEIWAVTLAITGFCAGFYGPIALLPQSNQGPLMGIFITGPGGLIGGSFAGLLFRFLPMSNARRWLALLIANVVYALGILMVLVFAPL